VSQDLRAVMIEAVLSVGSPIQPVSFPGVVTMKRKAEWFVAVVIPKQKGFLIRSR
jgi:preprotein translocase subunit Sec63